MLKQTLIAASLALVLAGSATADDHAKRGKPVPDKRPAPAASRSRASLGSREAAQGSDARL